MSFRYDRVHVWSCDVTDEPGGVATKLAALAQAGENLQFVSTRRLAEKPGWGVLYIAPVSGPDQVRAARAAGLHEVTNPVVIRVEGDNKAGLAHRLTHDWAMAGISFQGLSMAVVAEKFVGYASFDNAADANKAATIMADIATKGG